MSQENVELVRGWFERWNRRDREIVEDEVHPDMRVISRLQREPFRGPEGLRRWMEEIDEQFQEWELLTDEWRDAGDRVVVIGRIRLQGRESGVGFDQPAGWIVEVRDGRLFSLQTFVEPEEALRVAGLEA